MSVLVSIIIPVFNSENDVERCIVSALSQTFKDIEVIIVDDGSTDNSGSICDKWQQKDSRITVIHQKNAGVSAARNAGLDIAKGDFVCFFDSDDYAHVEMIEKLYNKIISEDADMCTCRIYHNGKKVLNTPISHEIIINSFKPCKFFSDYISTGTEQYNVWPSMFKLSIINKYHIRFVDYSEIFSEDTLFNFMYWSVCKKLELIDDHLCYLHRHENSLMTSSVPGDYIRRHTKLVEEYEKFIKSNNLKVNVKSETAGLLWDFIRIACARSKGNVNLIVKDFTIASENKLFKKKMRSLAFGIAGMKYCKYNNIKGKMALHFRLTAFYLFRGYFEKATKQYFI